MTGRAILREDAWPLRQRILTHERRGAGDGNAGVGQLNRPRRINLGSRGRGDVFGIVLVRPQREVSQQASARDHHGHETQVKTMPEFPFPEVGHCHQHGHQQHRNDDGPDHFRVAGEVLQEFKQEQEIPFGARRRVLLGGVGRGTQGRSVVANDEENDHQQYRQTRDSIAQHLIWPEANIRALFWFGRLNSMPPKEIDVDDDKQHYSAGYDTSVQCKKPR